MPTAEPVAALPEMRLDVELFYAERWMRVRETVDLTNTSGDSWNEIVFNVPIDHLEGAFYLDAVSVTVGESSGDALPRFAPPETALRVPLPHPAAPGEAVHVEMRYRVVIPPVGPTDWPPTGTTGWTFGLIQAGEWYPSLVPYVPGEGWHTWKYREVGDPTVYPLINADLTVRAGPGVIVASGGPRGQDAGGAWRFHVDRARGIAFLASDRYQMVDGEADGVPIHSFFLPEHAAAGQAALDIAGQAIRLFDELYGSYPYDSLTVAENGFFGGMEYSALISITNYAYLVYPGEPPSLLHALTAHETAHQWWYGAVGNDQPDAPWLDESLAFYGELLYFERYAPDQTGWWWEKRVDQYAPEGPVDASIYAYDDSSRFIESMYGQAARFLRDLRSLMGDDAFFAFLRDYYVTYQWQTVTADDFFAAAQRHTQADLAPLIAQYFRMQPLSPSTIPSAAGDLTAALQDHGRSRRAGGRGLQWGHVETPYR